MPGAFDFSRIVCGQPAAAQKSKLDLTRQYLLLATNRTSTLEREIQQAASAGYRVELGCKPQHYGERMVLMNKVARPPAIYHYKLLATQLTSTMKRGIEMAADHGYHVVRRAMMGDDEIVVILEEPSGLGPLPDNEQPAAGFHYSFLPQRGAVLPPRTHCDP